MKTTLKFLFTLMAVWSLSSCIDDDGAITPGPNNPVSVQFSQGQFTLSENSGLSEISLVFDKPTVLSGTISVQVTSDHLASFTTEPVITEGKIQVPVTPGQSLAKIKIQPVNNTTMDGDKTISFAIVQTTTGFQKGLLDSTTIKIVDDESPATINFLSNSASVRENTPEGLTVMVNFSASTPAAGVLEIEITSASAQYGTHFTTSPAAVSNKITLQVAEGATHTTFTILPVNNNIINGNKDILFKITSAQGGIQRGALTGHLVTLIDDELDSKPKSFETVAGDKVKKTFEYDEQGRVSIVTWETYTPFLRTGKDKYYYSPAGDLTRINKYEQGDAAIDVHYIWENGRIVKSEEVQNGIKTKYNEYFYDDFGNVDATTYYNRQSNGTYKLWLVIDYLYFIDGNLYKSISSSPTEGGEFITLSTKTYDGYVNGVNPFPMVEILPGMSTMHKLPTYHKVEENGFVFTYNITYTLREDGLPVNRSVTGSGGSQSTTYEYY